jgi:type II secretory pathway pseudopilin PulG
MKRSCLLAASHDRQARGYTVMEMTAALAILLMAMTLVAQLSYWSLRERTRIGTRRLAQELAANTLETARACQWEELNAEWAAGYVLPQEFALSLPGGKLTVQVDDEPAIPAIKRVHVRVDWRLPEGIPARPVELVSWFSARVSPGSEREP